MVEEDIDDEILINNNIKKVNNVFDACKGTIKVVLKEEKKASGFFLKFKRNSKMFYCIMTNEHVVEKIEEGEEIKIKYENEKKILKFKLDKNERIIKRFKELPKSTK